jgi:UDP-N-acetylglucosamine 2-epimerase (non-hydrolysing)
MLDQVLEIFDIKPDFDLNLMQPNQSLSQLTARVLTAFAEVVEAEKPDWVLVQGDTTTVMAASLVAYYHRVKVGHVEAGLRTGDKFQPFPEEINRRIADVLADLYFAPTEQNRQALLRENYPGSAIVVTGNTGIDALMMTARRVKNQPLDNHIPNIGGKRLILVTAHRRENFGVPLLNICYALKEIANRYRDDVHLVYPVHRNPNVVGPVYEKLADVPNISLIEPVDYDTMVKLMMRSHLILSDSGGVQEEAPSLDKPVLVLLETTERPEAVELGANKLVGTDPQMIINETARLLDNTHAYHAMASIANPYGDGRASERTVQAILRYEREKAATTA